MDQNSQASTWDEHVRAAQIRAFAAANLEVLDLYLAVGRDLLENSGAVGDSDIPRLAADLAAEFPDQRVWTSENLRMMKTAAQRWSDVDALVASLGNVGWDEVVSYLRGHH